MFYFKVLSICLLYISSALAEAPYAAAGWRPQRPFNLPNDYLPPTRDIEQQRQQQQPGYVFEISKQRVDFAGQISPNSFPSSANSQPINAYPSPRKSNTDFFKVQRPPYKSPPPQFVSQTIGTRPQNEQKTQIFQISNAEQPERSFGVRQESRISQPAKTYGPPGGDRKFTINYPDTEPKSFDSQQQGGVEEVDEGARLAIEALNVARDAYNRQQEDEEEVVNNGYDGAAEAVVGEVGGGGYEDNRSSVGDYPAARTSRGQYYVLGPDNRFQLVRFTTLQSEEEAQNMGGFSAQLRYIPVGEINDPIFKYDNRGQLVRIFKK